MFTTWFIWISRAEYLIVIFMDKIKWELTALNIIFVLSIFNENNGFFSVWNLSTKNCILSLNSFGVCEWSKGQKDTAKKLFLLEMELNAFESFLFVFSVISGYTWMCVSSYKLCAIGLWLEIISFNNFIILKTHQEKFKNAREFKKTRWGTDSSTNKAILQFL